MHVLFLIFENSPLSRQLNSIVESIYTPTFTTTQKTNTSINTNAGSMDSPLYLKNLKDYEKFKGLIVPPIEDYNMVDYNNNDFCDMIYELLQHFVKNQKEILLIGSGTLILLATKPRLPPFTWIFNRYSFTGPSNSENFKNGLLLTYPSVEDFIKENGGNFTKGSSKMHLIIDENLITCQSETAALIAIQAFILLVTN
ncbi:Glutamine amidotransferase-like class 1 domain-containing protein 1 [Lobulomyces angularis]|nr:Glutamine amidotransferase-like class 1 domain-containing protein 1 [Lobulomyces angularis]